MDILAILSPFDTDSVTGVDIRVDTDAQAQYHSLKDLRNMVRASERKALSMEDVYSLNSEWKKIYQEAIHILENRSKDLEVVAWLIEASIRIEGFVGLEKTLDLLGKLLDKYWDDLFPLPDEEGVSARVFPLAGLNGISGEGTLIMPIRMAPLVYLDDGTHISGWEYAKACELAQTVDESKKQKKVDEGFVSLDSLRLSASTTTITTHIGIKTSIQACIEQFSSIDRFLTEKCALDAPPTSQIKNALEEALRAISDIAPVMETEEEVSTDSDEDDDMSETSSQENRNTGGSGIRNVRNYYPDSREQALMLIARLARYFRDTEPHSPISYQMERVERWGNMSLVELMDELLDDESLRSRYYRLIGVGGSDSSD